MYSFFGRTGDDNSSPMKTTVSLPKRNSYDSIAGAGHGFDYSLKGCRVSACRDGQVAYTRAVDWLGDRLRGSLAKSALLLPAASY